MYKTFQTSFLRGQISLKSNNPCYQLWGEKLKPDLAEQNEKVRKISQRERRDFNGCNLGGTHFYTIYSHRLIHTSCIYMLTNIHFLSPLFLMSSKYTWSKIFLLCGFDT